MSHSSAASPQLWDGPGWVPEQEPGSGAARAVSHAEMGPAGRHAVPAPYCRGLSQRGFCPPPDLTTWRAETP